MLKVEILVVKAIILLTVKHLIVGSFLSHISRLCIACIMHMQMDCH